MSQFFFVFVSFIALAAGAYPKIGDAVNLVGTYNNTPYSEAYSYVGNDPSTDLPRVKIDVIYDGEVFYSGEETWDELFTPNHYQEVMKKCGSIDGTSKETITVTSGKFETCKIVDVEDGSIVWIGDVPFGVVKLIVERPGVEGYLELSKISAAAPPSVR